MYGCAWHWSYICHGVPILFAFMPAVGCKVYDVLGCNTISDSARQLVNASAHELMEIITDGWGTAWYDHANAEIADKCEGDYQSCILFSGFSWQVQSLWSNSARGCVTK